MQDKEPEISNFSKKRVGVCPKGSDDVTSERATGMLGEKCIMCDCEPRYLRLLLPVIVVPDRMIEQILD